MAIYDAVYTLFDGKVDFDYPDICDLRGTVSHKKTPKEWRDRELFDDMPRIEDFDFHHLGDFGRAIADRMVEETNKPVFDPAVQLWRIIHSHNLNHTDDDFPHMSECNGKVTVQIGDTEKFEYSSWRDAVKAVEDASWYLSKEEVCDIVTCATGFNLFPLGAWSFNQNNDDTVTFDPRERISFSDFAEFNNLMHGRNYSIRNVESERLKDVMRCIHIEQLTDTIKTVLKGTVDAMRKGQRCTFMNMYGRVDSYVEDPSKYVE